MAFTEQLKEAETSCVVVDGKELKVDVNKGGTMQITEAAVIWPGQVGNAGVVTYIRPKHGRRAGGGESGIVEAAHEERLQNDRCCGWSVC